MIETDKKRKRVYLDASFTVEAAFVVPVVVFLVASIYFAVLYLHNSIKAEADMDMTFFTMEREAASGGNASGKNSKNMTDELTRYYGASIKKAFFERNANSYKGELVIKQDIPIEGIFAKMLSSVSGITRNVEQRVPDRSETVRIIKASWELVTDLVDVVKNSGKKG